MSMCIACDPDNDVMGAIYVWTSNALAQLTIDGKTSDVTKQWFTLALASNLTVTAVDYWLMACSKHPRAPATSTTMAARRRTRAAIAPHRPRIGAGPDRATSRNTRYYGVYATYAAATSAGGPLVGPGGLVTSEGRGCWSAREDW